MQEILSLCQSNNKITEQHATRFASRQQTGCTAPTVPRLPSVSLPHNSTSSAEDTRTGHPACCLGTARTAVAAATPSSQSVTTATSADEPPVTVKRPDSPASHDVVGPRISGCASQGPLVTRQPLATLAAHPPGAAATAVAAAAGPWSRRFSGSRSAILRAKVVPRRGVLEAVRGKCGVPVEATLVLA